MLNSIQLMFFIIGLYFFFIISGIFEEKIFKEPAVVDGVKYTFKYPFVTIFLNSFFGLVISQSFLWVLSGKGQIKSPLNNLDRAILGSYSLICKLTNETSLRYLDYITRIIGKSCKSMSIIGIYFIYRLPLLGNLLKHMIHIKQETELHHSGHGDLFKVLITTASIILFSLDESGSGSQKSETNDYIVLGYVLLLTSLLFDGIIAIKEKTINHDVHYNPEYSEYKKILSWDYMHCFSLWTFLFSLCGIGYSYLFTNFGNDILIFFKSPGFFMNLVLATLFSAMGQVFIFQILDKYGPLTLSIITGVRKILSIIVSIIYFNKALGTIKMISLVLGGSVIIWEILEKSLKPNKSKTH